MNTPALLSRYEAFFAKVPEARPPYALPIDRIDLQETGSTKVETVYSGPDRNLHAALCVCRCAVEDWYMATETPAFRQMMEVERHANIRVVLALDESKSPTAHPKTVCPHTALLNAAEKLAGMPTT